jgi:hypothetical protein
MNTRGLLGAFAHSLTDPSSLSPEEMTQMWGRTLFSANVAFDDYRQGIISEDRWYRIRGIFVSYVNHPIGRIIWKGEADAAGIDGDRAFYESVQERLDEIPPNATQIWFVEMLEEVRALSVETPSTLN